jgi:hypothetical protein
MPRKNTRTRSDGSKAPSIYNVAREARVSVFTVSAVMAGLLPSASYHH